MSRNLLPNSVATTRMSAVPKDPSLAGVPAHRAESQGAYDLARAVGTTQGLAGNANEADDALTEATMRAMKLFAAAFVIAAGAFWVTMATAPPKTVASETRNVGLSPGEMLPADLGTSSGADPY